MGRWGSLSRSLPDGVLILHMTLQTPLISATLVVFLRYYARKVFKSLLFPEDSVVEW